ncbi:acyl-CoA dehydrogenase family protein [Pseudonocardia endophytica]|uniref:Alkylation response protein AidB-like acyl-CoA dehydrogenase n=1 Tax=Pseudonocardia endophytica TaxID=401976 RepID=A0A4R1HQM1_PSEEN|nr:acyl-CoA dehydrogenase family protein [Pseudonocardia endophytica]TCK22059.1 alkylation response protein AidB-like acyl-CoA dehydrogenase [Pseudonocardia endophytica]
MTLTTGPDTATRRTPLDDALLAAVHTRAPHYDRENLFFTEDLDALREAGHLRGPVPEELGGLGLTLDETAHVQRTLAYWAPSTALATTMHLYWVGNAADRYRSGDHRQEWLLREAAAGKVIAAGHGEPGNDTAIDDSTTAAVPVDGGYRITGHKIFTSLAPAWDWIGIHARDDSDPDHPRLVHGFLARSDEGIETVETWDTLGVRATASHDTVLRDVFLPAERVIEVQDLGTPPSPAVAGIFAWVLPLLGNVYYGIARRAVDVALETAGKRTAVSRGGAPVAEKPFVQYHAAEAELLLEGVVAQLDTLTRELTDGVDHGDRLLVKLFAAKENGTRAAQKAVDLALEIGGAGSIAKRSELERLYRDVRAGTFHPPNSDFVRDVIGRTVLGLFP